MRVPGGRRLDKVRAEAPGSNCRRARRDTRRQDEGVGRALLGIRRYALRTPVLLTPPATPGARTVRWYQGYALCK